MELSKEKQGEIALAVLKLKLRKDRRVPEIEGLKRNLGNFCKETGFSKEELIEFQIILVKEMTEEFISEAEKIGKTGASK